MNRREFLMVLGAAVIAAPAAVSLPGCGGGGGDSAPAAATGFNAASSVDFQHSHTITIPFTDLTSPPSGGAQYTSDGATHVHTVTLTQQQLTDINNSQTVAVVSNADASGHTHTWTIAKP